MVSLSCTRRYFLLCPICQKTRSCLGGHLRSACMKNYTDEERELVVEKAKNDVIALLSTGRVFSYGQICKIFHGPDPINRMCDELQRRQLVVTERPPRRTFAATPPAERGAATDSEHKSESNSGGKAYQCDPNAQLKVSSRKQEADNALNHKEEKINHKLVRKKTVQWRNDELFPHQHSTGIHSLPTPRECQALLQAAKKDFLSCIRKAAGGIEPMKRSEYTLILYYLQALLVLKHLQKLGVIKHMTVEDWINRQPCGPEYVIVGVKEYKRGVQTESSFVLDQEEAHWFDTYYHDVRPQFMSGKRRHDGQAVHQGRFFICTSGGPIKSISHDLSRLHKVYELLPVTSTVARTVFERATMNMTDTDKSLLADYMTDKSTPSETRPHNLVMARRLLSKLTGDLDAKSSDKGEGEDSNPLMDVQAAFEKLITLHPVTLNGNVPDRALRCAVSAEFQQKMCKRWLRTQRRQRMDHVFSHFRQRLPSERRVSTWIAKQGWTSNVPSADLIVREWRPTGNVYAAVNSKPIRRLIKTQRWKGLEVIETEGKGKGVFATRQFWAGEVVCDYHGAVVTAAEGHRIHQTTGENETGYMFFYENKKGEPMCIDAHSHSCQCHPTLDTYGRRINHSRKKWNLRPRLNTVESEEQEKDVILFFASRDIAAGEELLFNYGVKKKLFRGEGLDLNWM